MHRCDNADSNGTATGKYDGTVAVYRDESLGSYDATQLRHQEMNAIQEEIANVIRGEGYSLQTDTETVAQMFQLETAINNKLYASRISNDSGVSGTNVDDALDQLNSDISGLGSDNIANDSTVSGTTVSDALETLDNIIDTFHGNFIFETNTLHTGLEESNDMILHASDHDSGTPVASGDVTVRGGRQGAGSLEDTGYDGGSVLVQGGNGCKARTLTGTRGGDVTVQGGDAGGSVSNADSSNPPGDVFITGGTNVRVASRAGDVIITGGLDNGDKSGTLSGHVKITGGDHANTGSTGTAGNIELEPGHDAHSSSPVQGQIIIRGPDGGAHTLKMLINNLPTSDPSVSGQLFTQTATQLGGSGTTKVLCVS